MAKFPSEMNHRGVVDPLDKLMIHNSANGETEYTTVGELLTASADWYGVEWDITVSTTPMTRIGNLVLHRTLPIQNRILGCLVSDAGVVTYLPSIWTGAVLNGSAGQVMVEIPAHYRLFVSDGNKRRVQISEYALPGYTLVPKRYVSAYEATVARTSSKLSSVVNATTEYRGGNNSATNDANSNTLLGKPATNLSRANFRTYARNRGAGWEMYDYNTHNAIFWLYFVEYANSNSQLAVNAALDTNGYKQGGLGIGVTGVVDGDWSTFNGYYPIVNCGASNALGNGSGEVATTIPFSTPISVKVNRYRGIELPFGHIWKNADGIIFDVKTAGDGGTPKAYVCAIPANYSDASVANYTLLGDMQRSDGYIKTLQNGSFVPLVAAGADSGTYWCDYYYQNAATTEFKTLLLGGSASEGARAGLGCSFTYSSVSFATANFGSRLIYYSA